MNFTDLIQTISTGDILLVAFLLLSLIQIAPIKVNPWSWIAKHVGRAINGEVMKKQDDQQKAIETIQSELDSMKKCSARKRADEARNRILRFDDELRRHVDHSLEFFEQAIADCDFYEEYCNGNKKYPNGKADSAIRNIRKTYDEVKEHNAFI